MHNIFINSLKATIINIIVALLFTFIILGALYKCSTQKLSEVFNLINTVAIKQQTSENNEEKEIKDLKLNQNRLEVYPEYGTCYGKINIPKIDVNIPIYFGDTLEILKKGVGHSSTSYFPGENGSIIYMAHNSKDMLRRLGELQIDDVINVYTNYGEFSYKIYDRKIVNETQWDLLPVQDEEEILMLYTCYPFVNIGYTKQRYVVYAKKI